MPAVHHLFANVVHHQGANLNRRVEGGVPREGLEQRIQLMRASCRNRAARGPSVKRGGAVSSDSEPHPKALLVALLVEQLTNGYGHGLAGYQEIDQLWTIHRGGLGSIRQVRGIGIRGRLNR